MFLTASTVCRANTKLAYVQIELSNESADFRHHVVNALHDGGSEVTLITPETFKKIPNHEQIPINPERGSYIVSVNGSQSPVIGTALINLKFTAENGSTI